LGKTEEESVFFFRLERAKKKGEGEVISPSRLRRKKKEKKGKPTVKRFVQGMRGKIAF